MSSADPVIVGRSRDRRWIQRSSADPVIVGRSSDRRKIQRSSVDPVIVGGSRDRRRISKSENPESVGSPSPPRGLVVGSSRRFNSSSHSRCARLQPSTIMLYAIDSIVLMRDVFMLMSYLHFVYDFYNK